MWQTDICFSVHGSIQASPQLAGSWVHCIDNLHFPWNVQSTQKSGFYGNLFFACTILLRYDLNLQEATQHWQPSIWMIWPVNTDVWIFVESAFCKIINMACKPGTRTHIDLVTILQQESCCPLVCANVPKAQECHAFCAAFALGSDRLHVIRRSDQDEDNMPWRPTLSKRGILQVKY